MTSSDKIHYLVKVIYYIFHNKEIVYDAKTAEYCLFNDDRNTIFEFSDIQILVYYEILQITSGNFFSGNKAFMLSNNWKSKIEVLLYENLNNLFEIYKVNNRDEIIDSL